MAGRAEVAVDGGETTDRPPSSSGPVFCAAAQTEEEKVALRGAAPRHSNNAEGSSAPRERLPGGFDPASVAGYRRGRGKLSVPTGRVEAGCA